LQRTKILAPFSVAKALRMICQINETNSRKFNLCNDLRRKRPSDTRFFRLRHAVCKIKDSV
jgi:hypothetical protein